MRQIYTQKNYQPRSSIGTLVHRARVEIGDALDREMLQFDLTAAQYVVVSMLAEGRCDNAAQMCKEMPYDPGAMTRMLDRLEQKQLVRRVRSQENRRSVRLELTEAGIAIHPVLRAASIAVFNRLLHGFSVDEARQFESFLMRLLANADG
ncbi:MarR family winged helix-turn-helix transcriptional regulator [Rugamonas rubra]|uniref:DNA-binding transcriptional regulator, MarR family n=1 Tax=Rugamonas rubra TaxID=758825 RepID=A0A1I4LD66_9BURK|nr:MarR family transcriptional regulator [Rugamonas rubra]SFL88743.1 DNA-binding transcriptional regulator, MarR family [Rugamonas rubra]